MKIIKKGKVVKRDDSKDIRFVCEECGCVFDLYPGEVRFNKSIDLDSDFELDDNGELQYKGDIEAFDVHAICPNCGKDIKQIFIGFDNVNKIYGGF